MTASGVKTASFTYDPMGRLFETSGGTAGITRFLYDGDELAADYDSAGTLARRYVHSDNVDDPVVQYDSAAVGAAARPFPMPDERGSIATLFYNGARYEICRTLNAKSTGLGLSDHITSAVWPSPGKAGARSSGENCNNYSEIFLFRLTIKRLLATTFKSNK